MSARRKSGTREWAAQSLNCCRGCANDCIYCYAAHNAARFGRRDRCEWRREVIDPRAVAKGYRRRPGVIMFPTAHDITIGNVSACLAVLKKILAAGNRVLVVSKPHLEVWREVLLELAPWGGMIELRFSITCETEIGREFWEPHAPSIAMRLAVLQYAYGRGWETSVSMEPLLEPWLARTLVDRVRPFVRSTIWIGACRHLAARTRWRLSGGEPHYRQLERWQSKEGMQEVYEKLAGIDAIRWKDSYQEALGLAGPEG